MIRTLFHQPDPLLNPSAGNVDWEDRTGEWWLLLQLQLNAAQKSLRDVSCRTNCLSLGKQFHQPEFKFAAKGNTPITSWGCGQSLTRKAWLTSAIISAEHTRQKNQKDNLQRHLNLSHKGHWDAGRGMRSIKPHGQGSQLWIHLHRELKT